MSETEFSYMIPHDDFMGINRHDEIIPNLYMGMSPLNYNEFDVIINCEPNVNSYLWQSLGTRGKIFVHFPMQDDDDFELDKYAIIDLAMLAHDMAVHDKKVLIHCSAGLNRSGVITAIVCWLHGINDPIAHIREKRDKWVLCNTTFENWVRKEIGWIDETLKEGS